MKIKFYGRLKEFVDGKDAVEIKLPSERKLIEIIRQLNIPEKYVSFAEKDGKKFDLDSIVRDGDEITVLPLLSGG
jgi:molybdopterin converting factor small subunit